MKTIKQSFKIIPQDKGLEGIYKQIELGGKVCYQSTHTITENSAKRFVEEVLIKNGHGRPLEHGTIYLKIYAKREEKYEQQVDGARNESWYEKRIVYTYLDDKYINNKYSKVNRIDHSKTVDVWTPCSYITTNMRVLVENNWLDDLKYLCEPTKYHEKRVTVNVVCDRQIQTEIKTHTTLSSTFESTRFCNYNKDKFGNELTFIESDNFPNIEIKHSPAYDNTWEVLMSAYEEAEAYYMTLIEAGVKPQFAAKVLPFGIKGEGYITGFISDWKHFFKMRTPINAHPDIQNISKGIKEEFIKLGYIKD